MKNKDFRQAAIFLLLTIALSYTIFWGPIALFKVPTINFVTGPSGPLWAILLFIAGGFVPSILGVLLTAKYDGKDGVRNLLKSSVRVKMGCKWYVFTLLAAGYYTVSLIILNSILGHRFDYAQYLVQLPTFLPLIITGPISEELGWRGFALKKLLKSISPVAASLVTGLVWSLWHLPLFYIVGSSQYELSMPFLPFLVTVTSSSFIYTYLFIQTKHNVFSAIFFHWIYTFTIQVVSSGIVRTSLYTWLEFIPALVLGLVFAALLSKRHTTAQAKTLAGQ